VIRQILRLLAGTFATVVLAVSACSGAAAAPADGPVAWSVKPADNESGNGRANFAYTAEPGQVISDAVVVTNYSADSLTLAMYGADGFTTAEGLLDLVPAGTPAIGIGLWTKTETSSITVAPDASVTVPFTLTVPADARPGDHVGGVVTSLRSESDDESLDIDRRLASRITVRVTGTLTVDVSVTHMSVDYIAPSSPFQPGTLTVSYRLSNTGNALIYATERVELTGLGGIGVVPLTGQSPEILPGDSIERTAVLTGVWPLLWSEARVAVTPIGIGVSGSVETVADTAGAWLVSPVWVGVLAVLLVATVLAIRLVLGRRRSASSAPTGSARHGTESSSPDETSAQPADTPAAPTASELTVLLEQAREAGRAEARDRIADGGPTADPPRPDDPSTVPADTERP
jgi:hypothetical protein